MLEDTSYSQLITDLNKPKVIDQTNLRTGGDVGSAVNAAISAHAAISTAHHPIPSGVSGSKVIGGYRLTFTAGLLTGFEEV